MPKPASKQEMQISLGFEAFDKMKNLVAKYLVLKYYNINDEVTSAMPSCQMRPVKEQRSYTTDSWSLCFMNTTSLSKSISRSKRTLGNCVWLTD